jgi:hypothetical protein
MAAKGRRRSARMHQVWEAPSRDAAAQPPTAELQPGREAHWAAWT